MCSVNIKALHSVAVAVPWLCVDDPVEPCTIAKADTFDDRVLHCASTKVALQ